MAVSILLHYPLAERLVRPANTSKASKMGWHKYFNQPQCTIQPVNFLANTSYHSVLQSCPWPIAHKALTDWWSLAWPQPQAPCRICFYKLCNGRLPFIGRRGIARHQTRVMATSGSQDQSADVITVVLPCSPWLPGSSQAVSHRQYSAGLLVLLQCL